MFVIGACCLAMGAGEPEKPISERLQGFATPEEHPVTAELIAEHTAVQPGGRTRIGVLFTIRDGWHIYAENPGDAGLPTSIAWSSPSAVSVGPIQWPAPEQFLDPGDIKTFGYSGRVVLASILTAPPGALAGKDLPLRTEVTWLACKDVCIPGSATLQFALPVRAEPPTTSAHAALFGPAR